MTNPSLIEEIVRYIDQYAHPLQIRIATNGLLPEKTVRLLKKLVCSCNCSFGVKISLDGFGKVYEELRGVPGGDEKVKRTIEGICELNASLPRTKKIDIEIGSTITPQNLSQLDLLLDFARQLEIGFFPKPAIHGGRFSNEGLIDPDFFSLNQEQKKQIISFTRKLRAFIKKTRTLKERILFYWFYTLMEDFLANKKNRINCYALRGSVGISPKGDVFPCISKPKPLGNINSIPFDKIWVSKQSNDLRNKISRGNCKCLTPCDTIPSLMVANLFSSFKLLFIA